MGKKLKTYLSILFFFSYGSIAFSQIATPTSAPITVHIQIDTAENIPSNQSFDPENFNILVSTTMSDTRSRPIVDLINNVYGTSPGVTLLYPTSVALINDATSDIIIVIPFETYIKGVVLSENGYPLEVAKTQAVVARCYAEGYAEQNSYPNFIAGGNSYSFNIFGSTKNQTYLAYVPSMPDWDNPASDSDGDSGQGTTLTTSQEIYSFCRNDSGQTVPNGPTTGSDVVIFGMYGQNFGGYSDDEIFDNVNENIWAFPPYLKSRSDYTTGQTPEGNQVGLDLAGAVSFAIASKWDYQGILNYYYAVTPPIVRAIDIYSEPDDTWVYSTEWNDNCSSGPSTTIDGMNICSHPDSRTPYTVQDYPFTGGAPASIFVTTSESIDTRANLQVVLGSGSNAVTATGNWLPFSQNNFPEWGGGFNFPYCADSVPISISGQGVNISISQSPSSQPTPAVNAGVSLQSNPAIPVGLSITQGPSTWFGYSPGTDGNYSVTVSGVTFLPNQTLICSGDGYDSPGLVVCQAPPNWAQPSCPSSWISTCPAATISCGGTTIAGVAKFKDIRYMILPSDIPTSQMQFNAQFASDDAVTILVNSQFAAGCGKGVNCLGFLDVKTLNNSLFQKGQNTIEIDVGDIYGAYYGVDFLIRANISPPTATFTNTPTLTKTPTPAATPTFTPNMNPTPLKTAQATVGPNGVTLSLPDPAELIVPPGVLNQGVTVTVDGYPTYSIPAPSGYQAVGNIIYSFQAVGPNGPISNFGNLSVTLAFPLPVTVSYAQAAYFDGAQWDMVSSSIGPDPTNPSVSALVVPTNHFSFWGIFAPVSTPTNTPTPTAVLNACPSFQTFSAGTPNGVALDGQGNLYVSDASVGAVDVFNQAGSMTGQVGLGDLVMPEGVALDSSNNLYVADWSQGYVYIYNSQGVNTKIWQVEFFMPYGVAVDNQNGYVYVTDQGRTNVTVMTENENYLNSWNMNMPYGVAVDSSGNVYVADNGTGQVDIYNSSWNGTGQVNVTKSPSPLAGVNYIEAGQDGLLYVSDGNGMVGSFNLSTADFLGNFQGTQNQYFNGTRELL